jgi:nucleotide-binding universal stress UspA family protein
MTVVLGTDLQPESQTLGEFAGLLAHRLGEALRIVHVSVDPKAPFVLGTDEEHHLGPVRAELEREGERIASATHADVQVHLAAGPIADALVTVAEWELATCLIVGAGIKRSWHPLGSTAERVSRKSSVAVLTIRDAQRLASWLSGERRLRVLVGADDGRAARAARSFAVTLGRAAPCEVDVVSVAPPEETHIRLGLPHPPGARTLSPDAVRIVEQELSRLAPDDETSVQIRVLSARGRPDAHLTALASNESFDLILVGQRRRAIVEQIWYASVARSVLNSAPVSVGCVPPAIDASPASCRPPRIVVVATDFSEASDQALVQACAVVASGGTIHLAHVVAQVASTDDSIAAREDAVRKLARLVRNEASRAPCPLESHLLDGDPADQLRAFSERLGADLLLIGVRRRPTLSRTVLGSVAQTLIEITRVPVLVVPLQAL